MPCNYSGQVTAQASWFNFYVARHAFAADAGRCTRHCPLALIDVAGQWQPRPRALYLPADSNQLAAALACMPHFSRVCVFVPCMFCCTHLPRTTHTAHYTARNLVTHAPRCASTCNQVVRPHACGIVRRGLIRLGKPRKLVAVPCIRHQPYEQQHDVRSSAPATRGHRYEGLLLPGRGGPCCTGAKGQGGE